MPSKGSTELKKKTLNLFLQSTSIRLSRKKSTPRLVLLSIAYDPAADFRVECNTLDASHCFLIVKPIASFLTGTFDPASRDQAALQRLAGFRVWMVTMQLFMKELNCSLEDLLLRYDHAYRTCARMTPGKVPEPAVYPADLGEVHRRQAILFGLLFSMYWAPPASEIRPRSLPVLRGLECQRDTATVIDRIDSGSGYKGVVSPFAFTARLDVPEGYSVARAQARQSAARVFVEQPEREFVIVVIADEDRVEFRRVGRLPDGNLSDHLMSPVLLNLDKFDENNKGLQMFWEALYLPPHTLGYPEWPKQMALGDSTITITNSGFLDWSRDFGYCIFKGKEAARRLGRRNAGEESRTDEDVYVAFYTSAHLRNKAVS